MQYVHVELFIRILLAALCGIFIGYERTSHNKEAGLRTHSIIALGACMMTILSIHGFSDAVKFDAARIAAQVVSGIGFLGAGIIFVRHGTVSGLTTAAGMWATAGVGMCFGCGMYDLGIFSTILILCIQILLHKSFVKKRTSETRTLSIDMLSKKKYVDELKQIFNDFGIQYRIVKLENVDDTILQLDAEVSAPLTTDWNEIFIDVMSKTYIKRITFE